MWKKKEERKKLQERNKLGGIPPNLKTNQQQQRHDYLEATFLRNVKKVFKMLVDPANLELSIKTCKILF